MKTINDLDFSVPKEIKRYTNHSREIGIMISNYIESTESMNKLKFAELVGKTPSDITRWVSGSHNFTILTLSLIEAKTGMSIIKELSNDNLKTYLKGDVFELKSEEELENIKLKKEVEELKKKLNSLKKNIKNPKSLKDKPSPHRRYKKMGEASLHSGVTEVSEPSDLMYGDKTKNRTKTTEKGVEIIVKPLIYK